jgi:hypothetical protein
MTTSAIVLFVGSAALLWGGLAFFLWVAMKK